MTDVWRRNDLLPVAVAAVFLTGKGFPPLISLNQA